MKANKKTLIAVKKFLNEDRESWDIDELKNDLVVDTNLLKCKSMGKDTLSTDECSIEWGEEEICNLQDFIDEYTYGFIEKICNILDSFIDEDISYYFEDDEY